jgi:hypothetical protein
MNQLARIGIAAVLATSVFLAAAGGVSADERSTISAAGSPYAGFKSVSTADNQFIALNELVCPVGGTPETTFELRIRAFRTALSSSLMPCKLQGFTGLMGTVSIVRDRYFSLDNQNRTYDLGAGVYLPNIQRRSAKNNLLSMTLLDPDGLQVQRFEFKSWSTPQRKRPFYRYHLKRLK